MQLLSLIQHIAIRNTYIQQFIFSRRLFREFREHSQSSKIKLTWKEAQFSIRLETTPLSSGKETGQVTINDSSQRNAWNVECVGDIQTTIITLKTSVQAGAC